MLAAERLRAGWLAVGTALGLAGCSAMPTLPQIELAMPTLPGFGAPAVSPAMEPAPLGPVDPAAIAAQSAATPVPAGSVSNAKPAFFVQWRSDMTGLTRRPRIDASTVLPKYPESAVRGNDSGTTTLESCVTVDGHLADVKLAQSSGSVVLDSATLAWARTAKFMPAEFNGQPMAVCGWRLDYQWKMDTGR